MRGKRPSRFDVSFCVASAAVVAALAVSGAAAQSLKTIHDFCAKKLCTDGLNPGAGLVEDAAGNLYGTTEGGGAHFTGAVFELVPNGNKWDYRILHNFCSKGGCADGATPKDSLIIDTNGNLYGTTYDGGTGGEGGTAFELMPNADRTKWTLHTLYSFCSLTGCADGTAPTSNLTYRGAASGAPYDGVSPLYGATTTGGEIGDGAAFELSPRPGKSRWKERVIYNFCPGDDCTKGGNPSGALIADNAGNLFGVTSAGGDLGLGVVFELVPKGSRWKETRLYSFCQLESCYDGSLPAGPLFLDGAGNLFGTATSGGTLNEGVVFKLVPDGVRSQENALYSFCAETGCADGAVPQAGVTLDSAGNIFGVAMNGGGSSNAGTLFELNASFSVLHTFCSRNKCKDGAVPLGVPIVDPSGRIFGVTQSGGANGEGTVFEATP